MNRFEEHAVQVFEDPPPSWKELLRGDGGKFPFRPATVGKWWILTVSACLQLLSDGLNLSAGVNPVFIVILACGSAVILVFGVIGLIRHYAGGQR